jgi:hypothetical protein
LEGVNTPSSKGVDKFLTFYEYKILAMKPKSKTQKKNKNHFLPAFYQKQWYTDANNCFAACYFFDKEQGLYKRISGNINSGNNKTWEQKLYHLRSDDEEQKLSLENLFDTELEKKSSIVFKKLKSDSIRNITTEERLILVRFVISLRIREPGIILPLKTDEVQKKDENLVKLDFLKGGGTLNEYYLSKNLSPDIKEYIDNLGLESIKLCVSSSEMIVKFMVEKFGEKSIISILDTSESRYKLLTSNYPVIGLKNIFSGNGYDIVFPLSSDKIIMIISEESSRQYKDMVRNTKLDNITISLNLAVLDNYTRNLAFKYQIYSNTSSYNEVLPNEYIEKYFQQ